MTTVISGSGSADFETVLPAAEGGTGTTASTGSGNVVLSASPTFTGTIGAAALTLTTPLPLASGGTGVASNVGTVASVNMLQTRTQGDFAAGTSGNGTAITPLNITFTPKQAGNKVILEFTINGEAQATDIVFIVSRNDTLLADSYGGNNRWEGIAAQAYDVDSTSTPGNMSIRILDLNTLATETTYKLQVRSSYGTALTFRLNRTYNSAGADQNEAMLSVVTATEIWT
jgi:hypothetical protein